MFISETVTIILFFPLLLPIWLERPFLGDDLDLGDSPQEARTADIELQKEALTLGPPEFRADLIRQLAKARNGAAARVMAEQLRRENNDDVIAVILQYLPEQEVPDNILNSIGLAYLKNGNPGIRYQAVRLLGAINSAVPATVKAVQELASAETQRAVRAAAWDILNKWPANAELGFLRSQAQNPDPEIRAAAVTAIARHPRAAEAKTELQKAVNDASLSVRQELAQVAAVLPAALSVELALKLAQDPHPGVRATIAELAGKTRHRELLPVLIEFAAADDAELRRLCQQSLRHYPTQAVLNRLTAHLSDPSRLVRKAAAESIVFMQNEINVTDTVVRRINDNDADTRLHVTRILEAVNAKDKGVDLATRLAVEQEPLNIAALISALTSFKASFAAEAIAGFARHNDHAVRAQVARAIGRLQVPSTFKLLNALATDGIDSENTTFASIDIRREAAHSMGLIGDGALFCDTLTRVLTEVKVTSWHERAVACWAAARQKPLNKNLLNRLVIQGTRAVITFPGAPPSMDADVVLVSVGFALTELARNNDAYRKAAETVLRVHMHDPDEAERQGRARTLPGLPNFEPSLDLRVYAAQALDWLNGHESKPVPRPIMTIRFPYRKISDTDY